MSFYNLLLYFKLLLDTIINLSSAVSFAFDKLPLHQHSRSIIIYRFVDFNWIIIFIVNARNTPSISSVKVHEYRNAALIIIISI